MLDDSPSNFGGTAKCALEIIRSAGMTMLVICIELENNPGTRVTNAAERTATRPCPKTRPCPPGRGLGRALSGNARPAVGKSSSPRHGRWSFSSTGMARISRGPVWTRATAEEVAALRQRIEARPELPWL